MQVSENLSHTEFVLWNIHKLNLFHFISILSSNGALRIIFGESHLAEEFRQITHYLVEQFRQIAHYLAEHLIQKDDILFNEKFLTRMQECKNAGMHVSKYASMQICIQVCKYVSM